MIDIYTIKDLESILKVNKRTLYKYLKEGSLKGVKVGKGWRFTESSIKEFVSHGTTFQQEPKVKKYDDEDALDLDSLQLEIIERQSDSKKDKVEDDDELIDVAEFMAERGL